MVWQNKTGMLWITLMQRIAQTYLSIPDTLYGGVKALKAKTDCIVISVHSYFALLSFVVSRYRTFI